MLNGCGACIFKKSVFCVVGMHSSGRGETFCRGRWSSDEALWSNIILLQSATHKKKKNYCYYPVSCFPSFPEGAQGTVKKHLFFPHLIFSLHLTYSSTLTWCSAVRSPLLAFSVSSAGSSFSIAYLSIRFHQDSGPLLERFHPSSRL